jgi:tRNA(Ile)-lysidine synthase
MRARLRAELRGDLALIPVARRNGLARAAAERAAAAELAERARIYPEGYAVLAPGQIGAPALAMLLRAISGGRLPVRPAAVAALARSPGPATLAGVRVLPAGRMGPGWLLVREFAAIAPSVAWRPGLVWDGRFRAEGDAAPGATLGALGADAARFRAASPLPAAVLRTLPAIRCDSALSQVPHLPYASSLSRLGGAVVRNAALPVCCAPFVVS